MLWCRGVEVITTAHLHSTKPELKFCTGSNPARGVSEIRNGEDLWQWSRLEMGLNAFRRSSIPQKQFIIIIIIIIILKYLGQWYFNIPACSCYFQELNEISSIPCEVTLLSSLRFEHFLSWYHLYPSPPPKIPMQREHRPTMTSHKLRIFNPLDASDWTVKKKNKFEAKIYYLAWYGPYLQVKLHYFSEKPLQEDSHSINENWFFHLIFICLELVCAPCHRTFTNDSKKLKATEQKKLQDIETSWSRN